MTKNAVCSWSGGKDSCFALMQAIKEGYAPCVLLNVLNEEGKISRSHGIPDVILNAQACSASLPLHLISSSWGDYEKHFTGALDHLRKKYELTHAVFGDIDLQAHRDWEEKVCANAQLKAVLPLWHQDRKHLVMQMINQNIQALIVSCNETMGDQFIGKQLTPELIQELELLGVDPCGENGEFHTLVINCPLFSNPIDVSITRALKHDNYWFSELSLKQL